MRQSSYEVSILENGTRTRASVSPGERTDRTDSLEVTNSLHVEGLYLSDLTTGMLLACSVCMNFSAHNIISPYLLHKVYSARRVWLKTRTKGHNTHHYEVEFEPGRCLLIATICLLLTNMLLLCFAGMISMSTPYVSFVGSIDCGGSDVCHRAMVNADHLFSGLVGSWALVGLITSFLLGVVTGLCIFEVHLYQLLVCKRRRIVDEAQEAQEAQEQFVQRLGFTPRSAIQVVERIHRIRSAVHAMEVEEASRPNIADGVPVCFAY